MRLHKYLALCGVASRRKAEQMIAQGRVCVNGEIISHMGYVLSQADEIQVDGYPVVPQADKVYLMFNKPLYVITTLSDEKSRRCVGDYFADYPKRVYPVGRLDYETEGLLILTNDGEMAHRLMHPSYQIGKTYIAHVVGIPALQTLSRLRNGVMLEDGMTSPARVEIIGQKQHGAIIRITLCQGKNRQVRRMLEAVGHEVIALKRTDFGPLSLGNLASGEYAELSPSQINALRILCKLG